jgi:predicted nucleic acid-binding protein
MAKSNKILLFDTDVIVNFLVKEHDPHSGAALWQAPAQLFDMIADGVVEGRISIFNLMELRYMLRRKKKISGIENEKLIFQISNSFNLVVQDEESIINAFNLQRGHGMDPFDSLLLSSYISMEPETIVISRDKAFLAAANNYRQAYTPEEYLNKYGH